MSMLEPNHERLQNTLTVLSDADVGGTPGGGVSRPAASDADKSVRDCFVRITQGLGLQVRVDDIGNIYARRAGTDDSAEPVVIGSHLDTVVPGGRFDGILGVAVALETVALLNDSGIETTRPIEVVNWTGEEGARFPPAMLGSGVVTGKWSAEYAQSRVDAEGLRLGDELSRIGYLGEQSNRLTAFHASLEAHIEQGKHLEEAGADIGIVSLIEPVRWCTITVTGRGGHAGGSGPRQRAEAIVAAGRMVATARDLSLDADDFTTTVGTMKVEPGSNNVIPHRVEFNLDIRSSDDDTIARRLTEVTDRFGQIGREEGVEVQVEPYWEMTGPEFAGEIRGLLRRVADERAVKWEELRGVIGHDSLHLSSMGPAAMLFTQTTNGLSHCEEESAPWESVLATAGVYANAVLGLANS
ncbi:Zn-dependent hydrolase [Brevibacterium daeguense]|uniref:Zn-dependent hydrolase n=1 Tax=Brevibacterium daeguense TaxID=909936 RepID=A0ABP8EF95_9MICO|nr:Zn-dependent hydrolase [Brevibacterium daeguense]